MKLRWLIPVAVLLPLVARALDNVVKARIETITIRVGEVTPLHLRPEFESAIHMPEEVTSVILGSPGSFKAEHNEGEPDYVYVKPITKDPAQSNLLIATKSGEHVTLELISDGSGDTAASQPVDFLIEYRATRSFLVSSDSGVVSVAKDGDPSTSAEPQLARHSLSAPTSAALSSSPASAALEEEYDQQMRINAPEWTKWEGKQIETSIGDIRQWNNQTAVSYSVLNNSSQPVEIVPPQIQITGRKLKKKKKEGKDITSDQLEIRNYRLSATRLEAGGRADGVVVFDRPNFKQSSEKLFLQIAEADQVDRPILIRLPFTPPIASRKEP
jgi:hypothetical protein